jgi:acetyl-CoA carboxylase biotin carboxylase subunit
MIEKVLIANRGEVAIRVIRACREIGIQTVAVFSDSDRDSLHVELADESVCIGPVASSESYLKIANIISAAEIADVDAIHPGYGFLAENAHFAEICEQCNITFIGPTAQCIRQMGDKNLARQTMMSAKVPVTPGSEGLIGTRDEALGVAKEIGYPVLIKAVAGGGGKGMRVAHNDVSLVQAFMTASAEAERSFGNPEVYMEKFIESSRHIEVQVLGDSHGNAVHVGERDCSIQRRHQKLFEEAPSPAINDSQRKKLGDIAVRAVKAVNYNNAGTVEFLYDIKAKEFYFMEMNTRIQVEHPVSEEISGIDLIKEQLIIASGEPMSFKQSEIKMSGHAMEFRVNAEDPSRKFQSSPGLVKSVHFPGGRGVRVDTFVYPGYEILPFYDSMIAKIITHGKDRAEAISIMARALDDFMIDGIKTTAPLGCALMASDQFKRGDYDTGFLEKFMDDWQFDDS